MYQTLLKPAFIDIKNFLIDTLFPITCITCGSEGQFICADCRSQLKKLEHQRCIVCQKPTPFGMTHGGCQTPFGADALVSFYDYHDEKVSEIIIAGKYKFLPGVYEALGEIIAPKFKTDFGHLLTPDAILCPIPLHSLRQHWRGFNQAEILCRTLSKHLGLAIEHPLVRNKITKTQKDLKREQRKENMSDAFTIVGNGRDRSLPAMDIHNKNFILVDDVTTTGATLQQAAMILKRNGAAKVICLTVARD